MAESHTKGPYPQKVIDFPTCGRWDCDDEYDWEVVTPSDVNYAAIKREQRIAYYHHPRDGWMRRLQAERDTHQRLRIVRRRKEQVSEDRCPLCRRRRFTTAKRVAWIATHPRQARRNWRAEPPTKARFPTEVEDV
jgi:hypothetical protein